MVCSPRLPCLAFSLLSLALPATLLGMAGASERYAARPTPNQGYWANSIIPKIPFYEDPRHDLRMKIAREAGYTTAFFEKLHPDHRPHESDDLDAQMDAYGVDHYMINRYWEGYDGPDQGRGWGQRRGMYGVSWYWHPGFIKNGEGVVTTPDDFGPDLAADDMKSFRRRSPPVEVYRPDFLPVPGQ